MAFLPACVGAFILLDLFDGKHGNTFTQVQWAQFGVGCLLLVLSVVAYWIGDRD